jgi:hypothetical protein
MTLETLNYLYTSQAAVEELYLTTTGSPAFTSDNKTNIPRPSLWTSICSYATRKVDLYCWQAGYDPNWLATSWIVRNWATTIATRMLCKRRLNSVPEALEDEYQEAVGDLENIRKGMMKIPGLPIRSNRFPAMSNYIIDDNFTVEKLRKQSITSSGGDSPNTQQDVAIQVINPYYGGP